MNYAHSQEIARALEPVLEDAALAQQLAAQARPAVWLQTTAVEDEAEIASGSTKLGGCPDLPAGVAWPERGRYPDHEQRVKPHREDSLAPDSRWRWARPEQVQLFRKEALQHVARLESTFPLSFVAQINFAEARSAGTLDADFPESGLLSVFYDLMEQPWGFNPADACALKLIFSEGDAELERRPQPPALLELPDHCRLAPMACELHACITALPLESAQWDSQGLALDEEQRDRFVEWWFDDAQNAASSGGEDSGCHRIGGWPTPVQGDMQTKCALVAAGHYCGNGDAYADEATRAVRDTATQWLLLLQIGSDEKGGMGWGDEGQVYLWMRRDDLRARRFDRVRLVLQCC